MRGERGGCSTRSRICYVRTKKVIYLLKYSYYHHQLTYDLPPSPSQLISYNVRLCQRTSQPEGGRKDAERNKLETYILTRT